MSKRQLREQQLHERLTATIAAAEAAASYADGGSGDDTDAEYTPWWQVYKEQKEEQHEDAMSLVSVESLIFVTASQQEYVQPPPPPPPSLPAPDTPPPAATSASDASTRLPPLVPAPAPLSSAVLSPSQHLPTHAAGVGGGGGGAGADGRAARHSSGGKRRAAAARSRHVPPTIAFGSRTAQRYMPDADDGTPLVIPDPWTVARRESDGRYFFHNTQTLRSVWTLQQDPATRIGPRLPEPWQIHLDPASCRPFYCNPISKTSLWNAVEVFALAEAEEQAAFAVAVQKLAPTVESPKMAAEDKGPENADASASTGAGGAAMSSRAGPDAEADAVRTVRGASRSIASKPTRRNHEHGVHTHAFHLQTVSYTEQGLPIKRRRRDDAAGFVLVVNVDSNGSFSTSSESETNVGDGGSAELLDEESESFRLAFHRNRVLRILAKQTKQEQRMIATAAGCVEEPCAEQPEAYNVAAGWNFDFPLDVGTAL